MPRTGLWRNSDFLKLWAGQTVSSFGTMFGALSLTALVFLDVTPAQMGLLAMAQGLPVLLFALFAGVWVDRIRRRPLMIVADLVRAGLLFTVPAAAAFGLLRMEQLYVVAFGVGLMGVAFELAYRSYLPSLVERDEILEGNARLSASESVAEVASPAVGGGLVQAFGGPVAVLIDGLTFAWSAGCIALIRRPEPAPVATAGTSVLAEIREGLGIVWRDRILRALILTAANSRFFGGFWGGLYALFLITELGFSPLLMGLTIGAGGIGSLGGALLSERMNRALGFGGSMLASKVGLALFGPLIPLAGGPIELAFAMIFVAQICGDPFWATYDIAQTSLRQAVAPERALGRVNSTMHVVQAGLEPVGALVAGLLAEVIGVRETLWVATVGGSVAIVWLLASPIPTLRELPGVKAAEDADGDAPGAGRVRGP